ncbi:hypothetical protein [Pseudomonas mosselii]|uniref:hypothetical protein n=1 Tax=Pseudomonas mosselii TaxID=78327 RepID=UPI0021D85993|nr:hypothetical protein [Pseudomonas mosselii]MCU9528369.1 hypothetical protein [Pseudomonas mosselii]MCU9535542.1 hypothetical protein [Pseudomonas mosselii]MCU9547393.1 hypothetical protein [Pseudomonas mosselii]
MKQLWPDGSVSTPRERVLEKILTDLSWLRWRTVIERMPFREPKEMVLHTLGLIELASTLDLITVEEEVRLHTLAYNASEYAQRRVFYGAQLLPPHDEEQIRRNFAGE